MHYIVSGLIIWMYLKHWVEFEIGFISKGFKVKDREKSKVGWYRWVEIDIMIKYKLERFNELNLVIG